MALNFYESEIALISEWMQQCEKKVLSRDIDNVPMRRH